MTSRPGQPKPRKKEKTKMQLIKRFGVVLMAVFALGVIVAATASAEATKVLPEPSKASPLKSTSKGGKGTLETVGGSKVECEAATGKSEFTSPNLGSFSVLFEKCKSFVFENLTCTGVGDNSGTVLLSGEVHYWLALLSKTLVGALVFLFKEFHFTCAGAFVKALVLVKGCGAALAEPTEKLVKLTKDVFAQTKGVSDIKQVLPENSTTELTCNTQTNVNETKFEESGQLGTAENEKFEQGGKSVEVLLMNK
jgi:hypothetical protein